MHRTLFSFGLLLGLAACSTDSRTVVRDWYGSSGARDSLLTDITGILGYAPDTMQWCSPEKLRLAFLDRPGEFPMRHVRKPDGSWILYLTRPQTDRNLVRALAYAIQDPVRAAHAETLVVTLHRTPKPRAGSGPVRSSLQVSIEDLKDRIGNASKDDAPITGVLTPNKPCGALSRGAGGT